MEQEKGRPGRRPRHTREFEFMADETAKAGLFESDAFKKAVAEEAAKQLAKLMQDAGAVAGGAGSTPVVDTGMRALMDGLATSLAELAGQGSGRVHVDPAILLQREKARERMVDLILKARE